MGKDRKTKAITAGYIYLKKTWQEWFTIVNLSQTFTFTHVDNKEGKRMSTIVVNPHITDAEWEVMRVVWANGRVTSKIGRASCRERV